LRLGKDRSLAESSAYPSLAATATTILTDGVVESQSLAAARGIGLDLIETSAERVAP
jgi:hypothetical protein